MPGELFYWALNMSLAGGLVGGLVLLLRRVRALPRRAVYLLWLIPLLRLWLPVSLPGRFSLMSLLRGLGARTVLVPAPWSGRAYPELVMSNVVRAAESYFPVVYKNAWLETFFSAAALVWLVGACAGLIAMAALYRAARREVRDAQPVGDGVYISRAVTGPAVYGVLRPKILLPPGVPEADLPYILAHERAHVRRRDNLLRCAALVTACVHWFNPLVWLLLRAFLADMELACDAAALARLPEDGRRAYALALVRVSAGRSLPVSAFGGANVRVRVESILSYKRLALVACMFLALFLAALFLVLLAGPYTA